MLVYFKILLCTASVTKCTSIYDDSIPLPVLDERIIKGMTEPEKEKGDDLLCDAYNYYNILDDIEILMKNKEQKGIDRIEVLITEGGPKFINVTMAEDDMRYLYKWEPTDFNELRATIDGTTTVYNRLVKLLRDMRSKRESFKNTTAKTNFEENSSYIAEEKKSMTLTELDDLIVRELLTPEEGGGRKLLKHAFKFFETLNEVKELILEKDPAGFDNLRNITRDGPKWLRTHYDESLLQSVYSFKNSDLLHLNVTIESTLNLLKSFAQC